MDWFIIRDQDHLGPFTQEDLEELYASNEINDETLVWNESLEESVTYGSLALDEPPPLPPEFNDVVSEQAEQIEQTEKTALVENEIEDEIDDEIEDESPHPRHSSRKLQMFWFIIFIILLTPIAIYFYQNKIFTRPSKMSLRDYTRLTEIVEKKSEATEFVFALAQDRSMLWIATNNSNQGKVAIKLKAIKNRFLGEGEVEAFALADLKNHLVAIKDMRFKKGFKLLDGYYEIELYTPSKLNKPLLSFVNNHKKQFQFFKKVLISTMKPEEFEKSLAKYAVKKKYNENQFWSELKQKYQTLKMITLQIQDGVRTVFGKQRYVDNQMNIKKKIESFESEYKLKYGNFFTNFVIANDKSYEQLARKNFPDKVDIIANYTRLSKLARSIGLESVQVMGDLERFKQWQDQVEVERFKEDSLARFQKIIDICDHKISIIQID